MQLANIIVQFCLNHYLNIHILWQLNQQEMFFHMKLEKIQTFIRFMVYTLFHMYALLGYRAIEY